MEWSKLFERVLSADYREVEEGGSFSAERIGATLMIYFQSSKGQKDWENNLDFPARPYGRMGDPLWYAHGGFLRVWRAVEPYLSELIGRRDFHRAVVAGYSHGAALAVFCHEYIWFHRPDLRGALQGVGYGCPRVVYGYPGKEILARWERFTVVRNLEDAVTYLPPALLGYRHVGKMMEVGKRGRYSPWDAHREKNILKELLIYEETSA